MNPDFLCRLSKPDGSTIEIWLDERQVDVMMDVDHPLRARLFETLDIVSIEVDGYVDDRAEPLRVGHV